MQYSIINFSEAAKEKRFDAEFYRTKYKDILHNICKNNFKYLSEIAVNKYKSMPENKNLTQWNYIEIDNIICSQNDYISNTIDIGDSIPSRASKIPKHGDILVSTVRPTRGAVCVLNSLPNNLVVSSGFAIVSPSGINKNYLYAILSSDIYLNIYETLTKASMYPAMSEEDFFNVPIPIFSDKFQKNIEKLVLKAHEEREKANILTKEAEKLLEKELGLDNFEIEKKSINYSIIDYKETLKNERIDAEYYQKKYEAILKKIRSYKGGIKTINTIGCLNIELSIVNENEEYEYIELASIDSTGAINKSSKIIGKYLPSRARKILKEEDVIISSVEGSLDKAALIFENKNNLICSTGFAVLNKNNFVNPATLFCFFRIRLIKDLLKQISKGTILTAFDNTSLGQFEIPIIDKNVQEEISLKIKEAYKARENAKNLLQKAKREVENAIENGES